MSSHLDVRVKKMSLISQVSVHDKLPRGPQEMLHMVS
jgi:hypothetical protein